MLLNLILLAIATAVASAQETKYIDAGITGEVSFSSPNYPKKYPDNAHIIYHIVGPVGSTIRFRSEAFKLEVGQAGSCDFDSVSLFEVVDGVSVAIGRPFCGYEGPKALVSTTNNVTAVFKSDSTLTNFGFNIVVQALGSCGGLVPVLASGSVFFGSPKFPEYYPSDSNCVYTVTAPIGSMILFETFRFLLAESENCENDYVTFSEVINGTTRTIGSRMCGSVGPDKIVSMTNSVTVFFKSGAVFAEKMGFAIEAQVLKSCGGSLILPETTRNGMFKSSFFSPNPDDQYPNNVTCIYTITGPVGSRILFDTERFSLQEGVFISDYLTFSELINGVSTYIGDSPYCGTRGPKDLISTTNSVNVVFRSDAGITDFGFAISTYALVPQLQSITVPARGKVIISSPNYPNPSHEHTLVVYNVTGPVGSRLQFDVVQFNLDDRETYVNFLQVRDGVVIDNWLYDINTGFSMFSSMTNSVTIHFKSGSRLYVRRSFQITAQATEATSD